MPRGGKVRPSSRTDLDRLREYQESLAPQKGMFSTLDQLVQQAPFERAPAEQWRGYLQPGRMLKRDEAQFPLKKEELEYALRELPEWSDQGVIEKPNLLRFLRERRPVFRQGVMTDDVIGDRFSEFEARPYYEQRGDPAEAATAPTAEAQRRRNRRLGIAASKFGPDVDTRLSHQSPGSRYEESVTRFNPRTGEFAFGSHFTNDTLSWSRTSSHDVPDVGRVRLVEEIQSDVHEAAAEKMPQRTEEYLTPEERTEFDLLMREGQRRLDETGHIDDSIHQRLKELRETAQPRVPRRGYMSPAEHDELKELEGIYQSLDSGRWTEFLTGPERTELSEIDEAIGDLSATRRDGGRDISDAEYESLMNEYQGRQDALIGLAETRAGLTRPHDPQRLEELRNKRQRTVPDAPFKNPEEYATLELKKQLLNAVNEDQDYLALTRGRDQAERYGMDLADEVGLHQFGEENQTAGMKYIYDKVYLSALKRLARRYGAELTQVEMPVGSKMDTRPNIMRDYEAESMSDFIENAVGEDGPDVISRLIGELDYFATRDAHGRVRSHWPEAEEARNIFHRFRDAWEDYERTEGLGTPEAKEAFANVDKAEGEMTRALEDLWEKYEAEVQREVPDAGVRNKTFPALRLTPEVKEKIKRIGFPLWSLMGFGVLPEDDGTEAPGYAKGGKVKGLKGLEERLRERRDAIREDIEYWKQLGAQESPDDIRELARLTRMLRNLKERKKEGLEFERGGSVRKMQKGGRAELEPNPGLEELRNVLDAITFSDRASEDVRRMSSAGLSQWTAVDPETDQLVYSGLVGGTDPETGEFDAFRGAGGLPSLEALKNLVPPGIVDELRMLPLYFGFGAEDPGTLEAADRSEEIYSRLQEGLDVPEAEGLEDYATESLGFMLGQLPVPGGTSARIARMASAPFRAAGRHLPGVTRMPESLRKAGRGASVVPGMGLEFFSPIVEPRMANYGMGTAFGTGFRGVSDALYEPTPLELAFEIMDKEDSPLSPEEAWEIASFLEPEEALFLLESLGSEPDKIDSGNGYAKGGRVGKPRVNRGDIVQKLMEHLEKGERTDFELLSHDYSSYLGVAPREIKKEILELSRLKNEGQLPKNPARSSRFRGWKVFSTPQSLDARREPIWRPHVPEKAEGGLVDEDEYAKGGKVRPNLMDLREQVSKLLQEDILTPGVEGSGKEMATPDPAQLPELQNIPEGVELSPEAQQTLDSLSEGLRRGQVTRREFLEGMATLASPVDPTTLLRGVESIPTPKAAAIIPEAPRRVLADSISWGELTESERGLIGRMFKNFLSHPDIGDPENPHLSGDADLARSILELDPGTEFTSPQRSLLEDLLMETYEEGNVFEGGFSEGEFETLRSLYRETTTHPDFTKQAREAAYRNVPDPDPKVKEIFEELVEDGYLFEDRMAYDIEDLMKGYELSEEQAKQLETMLLSPE